MKKILLILISVLLLFNTAFSATYIDYFTVDFSSEKPDSLKLLSYQCDNAGCTEATPYNIEYYMGDAGSACLVDYHNGVLTDSEFDECMAPYKVTNALDLNNCNTITNDCSGKVQLFAKFDTNVPFGYINYFFTDSDGYIPYQHGINSFSCSSDVCIETNAFPIHFNKVPVAEAEIGQ